MSIDPNYCTYTEVTFTLILGELYADSTDSGSIPPTVSLGLTGNVICLFVIFNLSVILYVRKTRKY